MLNSFTKNKVYEFEGLNNGVVSLVKAKWTGNILRWEGTIAILKMKDISEEGVYYFVPDNLIIKEI